MDGECGGGRKAKERTVKNVALIPTKKNYHDRIDGHLVRHDRVTGDVYDVVVPPLTP